MRQQIIVSGTGGQGVLFLTRFFAEAALLCGFDVLTSEIHGMAMRGGTVLSHVKVGGFHSPLVRKGHADKGLMLTGDNLKLHAGFMREGGDLFVNSPTEGEYESVDATGLAAELGSPAVANVILLGFAIGRATFFCNDDAARKVVDSISPPRHAELNLKAFDVGLKAAREEPTKASRSVAGR